MSGAIPILLIEGFDHVASAAHLHSKGWVASSTGGTGFVAGRFGGSAFRNTGSGTFPNYTKPLVSAIANGGGFSFGLAFGGDQGSANEEIATLQTAAGGRVVSIQIDTSRNLRVLNAAGTAVIGPIALSSGWSHIEVVGTIGASVTVTVYVNGISAGSASSVNLGTTAADRLRVGVPSASGAGCTLDDVFVAGSATQLGDVRVETIRPSSAGSSAQWTPNASTNVSRVGTANDGSTYDSDTTYNSDATAGHIDSFVAEQLSSSAATVYAIQTNIAARKDDAGTRQIADVIRQGGTNYAGTTSPGLSSNYVVYSQIHDQDPTGSDWTVSNVNADEYGYKLVT